ncbi:hypothetical protein R1flu_009243 [Riccia fluitans]|uniref:Uncharacterized protein n=1 Tax=Riccia fluitans TaxID=41844 RepID=A0ABD1Z1Z5_9MARC
MPKCSSLVILDLRFSWSLGKHDRNHSWNTIQGPQQPLQEAHVVVKSSQVLSRILFRWLESKLASELEWKGNAAYYLNPGIPLRRGICHAHRGVETWEQSEQLPSSSEKSNKR